MRVMDTPHRDASGLPIGRPLPGWTPPPRPPREPLIGRHCRLEPMHAGFAADLHAANSLDKGGRNWTYLAYGPFADAAAYRDWLVRTCLGDDPFFYVLVLPDGRPAGVAAYLRIAPDQGSIEVGHIHLSPLVQRGAAATEAMFLLMRRAFELGYRRYEWKCDALNAPSRAAAQRLGLSFEGVFRQASVYKGRNRDTAWYAAIDGEWPRLAAAFAAWLDPGNFDAEGRQRHSLRTFTRPVLVREG
jgi:RimJ/RimL family protein N-acetyltransferase